MWNPPRLGHLKITCVIRYFVRGRIKQKVWTEKNGPWQPMLFQAFYFSTFRMALSRTSNIRAT